MSLTALAAVAIAAAQLSVSVLPFENRTGEARYDVMEKGLSDMLLTDLASTEGLKVVERARLSEVISEQKLQRSRLFDPKTALQLGQLMGASHIVTGALLKVDPEVRLDVRLVDVKTGRVLVGENVVGAPDRLFELEQALVARFLGGLGKKGVLSARSGPQQLDTLLAYSEAVDRADQGDFKQASQAMAEVMKRDEFPLAKDRYADFLKRLHDASARRDELLSQGQRELDERVATALELKPDLDGARAEPLDRYLGYRVLAMNLQLLRLRAAVGPDCLPAQNAPTVALVRRKQREAAREALEAYFEQALAYLADADRANHNRRGMGVHGGHTVDAQRATELGLGRSPDEWSGPFRARLQLGTFIFTGNHWHYDVLRRLAPSPAQLLPSLAEPALKLFTEAQELAEHEPNAADRLEHASLVAMQHGDALLALGRREEAMARWQAALDAMPTGPHYKELEERMQKTLGTHDSWRALDAALKTCDSQATGQLATAAYTLLDYDEKGLLARAEKLTKVCAKAPQRWMAAAGYQQIAFAAGHAGNCPLFTRALQRVQKLAPDIGRNVEAYGRPCLEDP